MSQYVEVIIEYDELVKIIKSFLFQDENTQSLTKYDVEFIIFSNGAPCLYVSKEIMIGNTKGRIREELEDDTIRNMVLEYLNVTDYLYVSWKYLLEQNENNEKILKGVEFTFIPKNKKSFIKKLTNY